MTYERIQSFPNPDTFEFPELRALAAVWHEKKEQLEDDGAYKEFIKKLQREWAIETGIIERLYTWDRGVIELFQFNYAETYQSTQKRFAEWLESSLAIALAEWKRSLQAWSSDEENQG